MRFKAIQKYFRSLTQDLSLNKTVSNTSSSELKYQSQVAPKAVYPSGTLPSRQRLLEDRARDAVHCAEVSVVRDSLSARTTALILLALLGSLLRTVFPPTLEVLNPGVLRASRYQPRAGLPASRSHTWFNGLIILFRAEIPRTGCVFCAPLYSLHRCSTPRL